MELTKEGFLSDTVGFIVHGHVDHHVHRPQRGQAVISDTCIVTKSFYVLCLCDEVV